MRYDLSQADAVYLNAIASEAESYLAVERVGRDELDAEHFARLLLEVSTKFMESLGYARLGRSR